MPWWLIVLILIALALLMWAQARSCRPLYEARRERLRARGETSLDDWYEEHFAPLGLSYAATMTVVNLLADALHCHPTLVRPDDSCDACPLRIDRLHCFGGDDEFEEFDARLGEWAYDQEKRLDRETRRTLRRSWTDTRTVGDLIRCVEPYLRKSSDPGWPDEEIACGR